MCEYCDKEKPKSIGDEWTDMYISHCYLGYSIQCYDSATSMLINYCPMCGRKLKEDDDGND